MNNFITTVKTKTNKTDKPYRKNTNLGNSSCKCDGLSVCNHKKGK